MTWKAFFICSLFHFQINTFLDTKSVYIILHLLNFIVQWNIPKKCFNIGGNFETKKLQICKNVRFFWSSIAMECFMEQKNPEKCLDLSRVFPYCVEKKPLIIPKDYHNISDQNFSYSMFQDQPLRQAIDLQLPLLPQQV